MKTFLLAWVLVFFIIIPIAWAVIVAFTRSLRAADQEMREPETAWDRHKMPMSTDRIENGKGLVDETLSWQEAKRALGTDQLHCHRSEEK